ncbi:MAG: hypothetical protein M3Y87_25340 [Myxococcota bacterium]|nr:hypothetical protein [Myxococcota bacterium]
MGWREIERLRADIVALSCATMLPFLAMALYVESLFYEVGAVYNDAGLFAQVIHRNDLWLSVPAAFSETPRPYFHTHLTLFMVPLTLVSRVLPLGVAQLFALFHGVVVALVAGAAYRALFLAFGSRALGVGGAWALALCGICVHASWNAHFEIAIPALVWSASIALFQRRRQLALGLLLALFATREDAPFHFALFFGAVTMLAPPARAEDRAIAFRFLGVAIALGLVLVVMQRVFFPPLPVFALVYSGEPPWAHLTSAAWSERVRYLLAHRVDLWMPLCVVGIAGVVLRERVLLAALAAAAPWVALHLGASFEGASRFAIHYGFPLLTTLLAPSLAMIHSPSRGDAVRRRRLITVQIAVLALAAIRADASPPLYVLSPISGGFGHATDADVVRQTERVLDHLEAQRRAGASVCASDTVASLRRDLVGHRERIRAGGRAPLGCDLIVSFERDHDAEGIERARREGASRARCAVIDTHLVVDRPADAEWPFHCRS